MAEILITTKITMKALRLVRRIAVKTGEKQYRIWERLAEAEYEALNGKPTMKGKTR